METVQRLAYLGFDVSDLDAWETFGRTLAGFDCRRPRPDLLLARIDGYDRRLVFRHGAQDDLAYAGWEVRDFGALEQLAQRLAKAGYPVREGTPEELAERGVDALIRLTDRAGNPLEICCAPALAQAPCHTPLLTRGFVTGQKGLGHYVAGHPDLAAARALYCDLLGMRVSDYIFLPGPDGQTLRAMFLHANARHHSVALVEAPLPTRIDHFFVQMESLEDVGRAYDRFVDSSCRIRNTLGQHPNDRAISFYAATPGRFSIELGWSDFEVSDDGWTTRTFDRVSLWGHRPPAG